MIRNRLLAEERRMNRERQKAAQMKNFDNQLQSKSSEIQVINQNYNENEALVKSGKIIFPTIY